MTTTLYIMEGVILGVALGVILGLMWWSYQERRDAAEEVAMRIRRNASPEGGVRVSLARFRPLIRVNKCVLTANPNGPLIHARRGHPPIEISECHLHGSGDFPIILLDEETQPVQNTAPPMPDSSEWLARIATEEIGREIRRGAVASALLESAANLVQETEQAPPKEGPRLGEDL